MKKEKDDFVNPLDFFDDLDEDMNEISKKDNKADDDRATQDSAPAREKNSRGSAREQKKGHAVFITGTDTGVGKTTVIKIIATLLKDKGLDVGVMKPVQCGGEDAKSLKEFLQLKDPLAEINPYFAKDPHSPHVSFKRERIQIHREKILSIFEKMRRRHDVLLVEGAGGLQVPIKEDYLVSDLVKDMGIDLVIVSRLGLGTINHTLLTIDKARDLGVSVNGVIFSASEKKVPGVPEKTNPATIKFISKTSGLGIIPFIEEFTAESILKVCQNKIDLKPFLPNHKPSKSANLIADDKNYVWHPFTQMKDWLESDPLVIERGEGSYLIDTEGKKYLDGVSSLWVNIHGHNHPHINAAIKNQLTCLEHSTFLGLSNIPAIELAKKLIAIAPKGLEKVFYSDNGSTAVEVAVKMAYQYWQNKGRSAKIKIVHLANSYHDDTLGAVSVGGIDVFSQVYKNITFPTIKIESPDGLRPLDFENTVSELEKVLLQSGHEIAALIVEPVVQGAAGMIVWPDGILKKMKDLCEKHEVLLIADEVATGFGRTGKMFACEHDSVTPDFLCLAKGLTGGYLPLAATLTTKNVFEGFLYEYKEQKTFFHGHTYTANPLACAAALANIELFHKEHTLGKLQPKINFLSERLKMFHNLTHVGQVRQKGFMVGIELVGDKVTNEPYAWDDKMGVRVCQQARRRNIILRPLGNVIVLMPPLSISKRELDYLLQVTQWAIRQITEKHERVS